MWSLGCILAELYMGVPLFPGEDEHEQMACIMEVLGAPDQKLVQKSEKKYMFFGTSYFFFLPSFSLLYNTVCRSSRRTKTTL